MDSAAERRRFLAYFGSLGLSSTLLPGVLWAKLQDAKRSSITREMLRNAAVTAGLTFTDHELDAMLDGVNRSLGRYEQLHRAVLDNSLAPPLYFNPVVPGMKIDRAKRPLRPSRPPRVTRPADLEDVAFWSVVQLAELVRTRQVKSIELT